MEPVREPLWAEHEKLYLLAEILKAAPVPAQVLYNVVRDANIQQPRWTEMALPHGRSLRSCQTAYNDMMAAFAGPDHRRPPMPAGPSLLYPGPDLSRKRALPPETAMPPGRPLQPRPSQPYPGEMGGLPYGAAMSPVGEPANKKKRGRPTKAEAQQRAQDAAARGEVYPPPRKSRAPLPTGEQQQQQQQHHHHHQEQQQQQQQQQQEHRLAQTPPGRLSASFAGVSTPQQAQVEQTSESSSGKRRRNKPTPLELEKPQRMPSETESPLAYGSTAGESYRSRQFSTFTPISAPLPSSTEARDKDVRMEGVEETQARTTTPHSFKDTVGI